MKKMFFLMLLISALGIQQASAQTGVNNNSDYHVPPPSAPQLSQSAAGAAQTVTATTFPATPDIPVPVSMAQNVSANSLAPIPVEVPIAPAIPEFTAANNAITNTTGGGTNVTTTGTTAVTLNVTPGIPSLLPISELPGLPVLNLEVSSPIANTITGSAGSITGGTPSANGGVAGGIAPEVN